LNSERNRESEPDAAQLVKRTIIARVTMDCKMTCNADPSIVGTMIAGCFLQVQNDLSNILSKKILFTLNEETSLNLPGAASLVRGNP
jgi:hypothetical protein